MIPIVNRIMPSSRFADGSATKTAHNHKSQAGQHDRRHRKRRENDLLSQERQSER
jgi:hypothetical protein